MTESENFSFSQLLDAAAIRYADNIAIDCGSHRVSFKKLAEMSKAMASLLVIRKIGRGDIVAIRGRNTVELAAAIWAVLRIGAVLCPVHRLATVGEINYLQNHLSINVLITDEVELSIPQLSIIQISTLVSTVCSETEDVNLVNLSSEEPVYLAHTSGTTGNSKAFLFSHRQLLN